METGLILPVPEAEPVVGDPRARLDPNAAAGAPAHLTVLYPFRRWETVNRAVVVRLRALLRATRPFELSFAAVGRFPGVLWLAPAPSPPLEGLTRAVCEAFPDSPPYRGAIAQPAAHLTVAMQDDEGVLDEAERTLRARIVRPIRTRITALALYLRTERGRVQRRRFPLG